MKKILFVLPIVALLAAGCGKTATNAPTAQNNSQNQQPLQNKQQAPAAPAVQLKTLSEPTPTTAYAAAGDGFGINFPTAPTLAKTTFRSMGAGAVPVTEYTQEYVSGQEHAWYKVSVFHYPASYQFPNNILDLAMQVFNAAVNEKFPGSKITNQQPTQFLGNPALTGLVTVPLKLDPKSSAISNTGDYLLITTNGHNLYIISTYGMDQNNYNAFINSFKFIK
jgi:hypothetical protein